MNDQNFRMTRKQMIGLSLIVVSLLLIASIAYINSARRQVPIVFSERLLLQNLWENYKKEYIEENTYRTIDKQRDDITTSEGESYTMLRAVWQDDKVTFDRSLKWTKDILKHKDGNLHSWLFGRRPDGSFGVLNDRGGQNSATDAESDIALALIFAYSKWKDENYLKEAKAIIDEMWEKEVIEVNGVPILAANDIERNFRDKIIVNPSYFAPYAYRIFSKIDKDHDWMALISSSYDLIEKSSSAPLDKSSSAGIPPDWIEIDRRTGEVRTPSVSGLSTAYSYDALRLPWRIALDWQWYGDERAKKVLDSFGFFSREWESGGRIYSSYNHDGSPLEMTEDPAFYGGVIGYFMVSDKENAKEVYEQKIQVLYNPDTNSWRKVLNYYDDNWAWFGIGLYNNLLPNLADLLPEDAAERASS